MGDCWASGIMNQSTLYLWAARGVQNASPSPLVSPRRIKFPISYYPLTLLRNPFYRNEAATNMFDCSQNIPLQGVAWTSIKRVATFPPAPAIRTFMESPSDRLTFS